MKTLLFLTLAASVGHVLAESAVPQPYTRDRYDETVAESPFALATPPAEKEPEAEPVNLLTNLYITGITQLDGKDYITVKDLSGESFKLVGNEPLKADDGDPESQYIGVYAEKVNWSTGWSGVTVTLRHGSFKREGVKFREQAQPVMGQAAPGAQGMGLNGGQIQGGANRFQRAPVAPAANSIIPPGLNSQAVPATNNNPMGGRRGNLTPGAPRPAGTQNIPGQVPRPSGSGFQRGGNNGGGVTATPNSGAVRQRDRGPVRSR